MKIDTLLKPWLVRSSFLICKPMSQRKCHATFQDNCKVFKGDEKIWINIENFLDDVFIIAKYNRIKTIKKETWNKPQTQKYPNPVSKPLV